MRRLLISLLVMVSLNPTEAQVDSPLEAITFDHAGELREMGVLGRGAVYALAWHPAGERLAVGSATGVWLLDENLNIIDDTPIHQPITDLAWRADGSQIAVASPLHGRCTVQVWDADFREQVLSHAGCGAAVRWNAAGTYLAVFGLDSGSHDVQLIDITTHAITTLPGQDGAWSPDGAVLFTRFRTSDYASSTLYTWDTATQEVLFTLDIADGQPAAILWGLDERTLAGVCREYEADTDQLAITLCKLDMRTGDITTERKLDSLFLGEPGMLTHLKWNADETLLASVHERFSPGFLNAVFVLNTRTDEHTNIGNGAVFDWNPGSDTLTAAIGNGEIRTYDAKTGEILAESGWFTAPIHAIATRPDRDEIASTGFGYQQATMVWDMHSSWLDPRFSFSIEPAEIVDYTPDGSELIAGGTIMTDSVTNQRIAAFDPDTGERVRAIAAFYSQHESLTPGYWNATYTEFVETDEAAALTLEDAPNEVWNSSHTLRAVVVADGLEIYALQEESKPLVSLPAYGIIDLVWSADDRFIAGGAEDGTIRIWGVRSDG